MKKIFLTVASEIQKDAKKIKYSLVIGLIISALLCAEPVIKGMALSSALGMFLGVSAIMSATFYILILGATVKY